VTALSAPRVKQVIGLASDDDCANDLGTNDVDIQVVVVKVVKSTP
jgi:hypothetical protein